MTFIYILIDPKTGFVRYVGKANNPVKRLACHLCDTYKSHKVHWLQKLKSQGLKPILEVIDTVPMDEWEFWEKHYISLYKSWGFGLVNSDNGGKGLGRHTLEAKNKMKTVVRKKHVYTEEELKKMSDRFKGNKNINFGKPVSEERKSKIRFALVKRVDVVCGNCLKVFQTTPSLAKRQVFCSCECKKNKRVLQISLQNEVLKEWASASQAARELKLQQTNISGCCIGKNKTCGGFIWKFKT